MVSENKVALITGGASGMGLGVVEMLVKRGNWNIAILDMNPAAGKACEERFGDKILFIRVNVINYDEQAEAFVATWKKWGRLDMAWANAGIGDRMDFCAPIVTEGDAPPPKPDVMVIDICLYGVVWTSYLALHYFRKNANKSGKLLMTSSMAGIYPAGSISLYGAAKHGVVGLTRSLAQKITQQGENIQINCFNPGLVPTPLVSQALTSIYPQDRLTPVSTIVGAMETFLDDDTLTGKAAECSGTEVIYREPPGYSNADAEYLISGTFYKEVGHKLDHQEMLRDSIEKGKKVGDLLGSPPPPRV